MDSPEQLEAWDRYRENPTRSNRTELAELYVPLIRFVASRMAENLPKGAVDRSDLDSFGTFGLMDAIEKYDLDRGIQFDTYALQRIRGAILDGLRSLDHLPRSIRSRMKLLDGARDHDLDPGEVLGLEGRALDAELALIERARVSSLDAAMIETDEGPGIEPIDLNASVEDSLLGFEDVAEDLAAALRLLDERDQVLIAGHYLKGLAIKDLGPVIGVTESRCRHLHATALKRLAESLRRQRTLDRVCS